MTRNDPNHQHDLKTLVVKAQEGILSEAERDRLNDLMKVRENRKLYFEMTKVNCALYHLESSAFQQIRADGEELSSSRSLLEQLAEYEKVAPEIEVSQTDAPRELISNVVYRPPEKRKISTFSLVFLALNTAALLFLFLLVRLTPPSDGKAVATLTDSLDAKWAAGQEIEKGVSVAAGRGSLFLSKGCAQFRFDSQVRVTIEGPAEFEILNEDRIHLHYGRLYARVPREAIGFTVKTPSAQIVDLGTEFGVDCDLQSNTSLHVMKGKTILIAGDPSGKVGMEVRAGVAKAVSAVTQAVSDITCDEHRFVRTIDSDEHFAWHGETALSLADLVGGGNGFGKNPPLVGLDPVTGRLTASIDRSARKSETAYSPVPDSPFIDGVFVPDGGPDGQAVITSTGQTVPCPDTAGLFSHEITVYTGAIETRQDSIPPAIFGGRKYDESIVMIHSNAGITFDLQAIRQSLAGLDVTRFQAFGGLSEAMQGVRTKLPDVDFQVLVDGQVRYEKVPLTLEDDEISLDLELRPGDRFLTLIVTDGSRPGRPSRGYAAWNNDFFYLVNPTLQIADAAN